VAIETILEPVAPSAGAAPRFLRLHRMLRHAGLVAGAAVLLAVVAMALAGLGSLLLTQVSVGGTYLGDVFFGLVLLGPGIGAAYVAGSIASLTGVAETEAGLASGLNNASFQIGGAVGTAILSTVAVSGAHGSDSLAAVTNGFQSAFAVAIIIAALGAVAASLLLGSRRGRQAVAEAEPAAA
jgi:MFS family permease